MLAKDKIKILAISSMMVFLAVTGCAKSDNTTKKENDIKKETTEKTLEKQTEETTTIKTTEKKTEKSTQKKTEKKTEKPTKKAMEKKTEKPTKKATEKKTEKPTKKATEKKTEKQTPKPANYYDEQFNGDAFIGDSRTEGLLYASQITTADFLCSVGLNVKTVVKDGAVMGPLEEKEYRNIYIEFGVNELGWGSLDAFEESYSEFVKRVKRLQPDANIYVQSIIPVTQSKSDSSTSFTLERVELFTQRVKKVAKKNKVIYLDTAEGLCGKSRILPEEVSSDGVHLNREFCLKWLDFLISERKN